MSIITFVPSGRTIKTKGNETINKAAQRLGIDLGGFCNGNGTCKKCKVEIIENNGVRKDVFSCQHKVENDTIVYEKNSGNIIDDSFCLSEIFNSDGEEGYGIAVDIGTTSIVLSLCDLKSGKAIKTMSSLNSQTIFGADTISRIEYATKSDANLKIISKTIRDSINRMVLDLSKNIYISKYCVCGNTAMMHIFLGIMPEKLGVYPFESSYKGGVEGKAKDYNLLFPDATLYAIPNIKSHVGSDIASGISLLNYEKDKNYLYVDLGTNGEIVLVRNDDVIVASTAMGPALEGAGIECGMRAIPGAIEKVYFDGKDLKYKTINDDDIIGICGSGIISLIACLRRKGEIDLTGKLVNGKVFYISKDKRIYISQDDVRKVQLVKSALYSGIETMLDNMRISLEDIDKLYVAGAFGKHIDIKSSIEIGLLPNVKEIEVLGNSALNGCINYLVSKDYRNRVEKYCDKARHLSLSDNKMFIEHYVKNMYFF